MIQYTDSANEDESEEDTSIPSSETTGEIVAVEGEDGHQYVVLEVIQLDGQDQLENYSSASVSMQDVDQSRKYKSFFFIC